jgi:hypothetical protein
MGSRETQAESGVQGGIVPDKSPAGDDILRGPQSHAEDGGGEREVRKSHGGRTLTTRAQVHSPDEDMDSIHQLPPSSGVHAMTTRSKFRVPPDDMDSHISPPQRHEEFFIDTSIIGRTEELNGRFWTHSNNAPTSCSNFNLIFSCNS